MRKAILAVIVLAAAGGAAVWMRGPTGDLALQTAVVTEGPLVMTVETTGSVSPLVSVNVGCEVSGTVGELNADFNSFVKKDDVMARLRPELFEAELAQASANLALAEAKRQAASVELQRARRQFERLTRLREERNAAADEEVQTARENVAAAEANLAGAEASIKQAEAARDLNQTKLDRSVIYAPIDGIVLSRLVDVGQTVASALTTPVLFVLAPDLDRMQVHANVSESDIGQVRVSQRAEFTVDAFSETRFDGRVSQVRNNPTTISNVVTYTVVIEVDNRRRLLKPGMTANVVIEVARRERAAKVVNSALRFRPPIPSEEVAELTAGLTWPEASDPPAAMSGPAGAPSEPPAFTPRTNAVVWTYDAGRWRPVPVVLGITDNRETEILAGAAASSSIVVGATAPQKGFNFKEALRMASPQNRSL